MKLKELQEQLLKFKEMGCSDGWAVFEQWENDLKESISELRWRSYERKQFGRGTVYASENDNKDLYWQELQSHVDEVSDLLDKWIREDAGRSRKISHPVALLLVFAGLISCCGALSAAPYITNVVAKQRYPWNGKVDIAYKVVGDFESVTPSGMVPEIKVSAVDREYGREYVATTIEAKVTEGNHRVVWDMQEQGIRVKSSDVVFKISCAAVYPLYCVVDLSGGPQAARYPVSALSKIPEGGWTDEYKTTKLVLRRIDAGKFVMRGSVEGSEGIDVVLTKSFYLGVFEATQKQYELITGGNPSIGTHSATLPVGRVSYHMIRGSGEGAKWPSTDSVDEDSVLGKLRSKTSLKFDLPTGAQWEYACRSGTTGDYGGTGKIDEMGRYSGNGGGRAKVGSYLPNQWGLYDMHGNEWEWCRDWAASYSLPMVDPHGGSSGIWRIVRGGDSGSTADGCTSSTTNWNYPFYDYYGFRFYVEIQ